MANEGYIPVYTLANRFEADIVSDVLEREGVPFWIRSFEETAYDGLFVIQKGWGQVLVPRSGFHQAIRLIYSVLKNNPQKGLYEEPEQVDPKLWEELADKPIDDVCARAKVFFDKDRGAYEIPFLSTGILCYPEKRIIEFIRSLPYDRVDFELALVVLHYLIHAASLDPTGRWVGEKDIPGGNVFFYGPHQLPTRPLEELFQIDIEYFDKAARILGGIKEERGDRAYVFHLFPRVPVLLIFWKGDEEFEPKVNFRFDETIIRHFPMLDQIFALSYVVYRHIVAAAKA
ncbi:MAG: DUF3786 domain-containing protein [Syntrophobacterales bacterium]|nr:DUF3786 domain-containing protein [Syntrophobacterales bacterium]